MDIFSILTLLGGLAFFLYGMNIMSNGLEKMVGGKLDGIVKSMTSSRIKGLALGAAVTAMIQSSSAVTVMLVGLVNSGIMQLNQSIGVIMGSNIGTTITAWILSLTGIESDNIFLNLLKPDSFSPVLALVGIILVSAFKDSKKADLGSIFIGFALLMYGMSLMSDAMAPLGEMPEFTNLLVKFSNPLMGIFVGTAFTALIQSSAASIGILQSLALTGSLTYGAALPIIMGQNIGTCITALLSSIGTNKNAKRVTAVHISFNTIGTVVWMSIYYILDSIFHFEITTQPASAVGIAIIHSIFNVITTLMLFPFGKQLEKLAKFIIKDGPTTYELLDERLLNTPALAIAESYKATVKMAHITRNAILSAIKLIHAYDAKAVDHIKEAENEADFYEDKIGSYLVRLSSQRNSQEESEDIAELLHSIGDLERIADHALNIAQVAEEIHMKKLIFSDDADAELKVMSDAVDSILTLTFDAFEKNDPVLAGKVEPLEQVIDKLKMQLKKRHIKRLQGGQCTIELGFVFSDILNNYERISDHCSNIAIYVLQNADWEIEAHGYMSEVRSRENPEFMNQYNAYLQQYKLPDTEPVEAAVKQS